MEKEPPHWRGDTERPRDNRAAAYHGPLGRDTSRTVADDSCSAELSVHVRPVNRRTAGRGHHRNWRAHVQLRDSFFPQGVDRSGGEDGEDVWLWTKWCARTSSQQKSDCRHRARWRLWKGHSCREVRFSGTL